MDNETRCPNCGTTKYANANLRMMVNVCGHSLCESCVEQLFVKGSAKCPTCGVLLKRVQFRIQLYDDETVEKDLEIRRRLLKDLNLQEEDFSSLKEYNDYLEMFETFVYNLAQDIDVLETGRKIDQFKTEHADKLTKSRNKISKDLELIEQILEEERDNEMNRSQIIPDVDTNIAAKKVAEYKENLLDALIKSDLPADAIMRSHKVKAETELAAIDQEYNLQQKKRQVELRRRRQPKPKFTGLNQTTVNVFDEHAMEMDDDGERYVYEPLRLPHVGPTCPSPRTIIKKGYLANVRAPDMAELAGGFLPLYPCQLALQEAIMDLTFIIT